MRNLILLTTIVCFSIPAFGNTAADQAQDNTVDFQGSGIVINAESPSDDRFVLPTNAPEELRAKRENLARMQQEYAGLQVEIQKLTLGLSFDGAGNATVVSKINAMVTQANQMLVFLEDAEHDFVVEKDVFLAGPITQEPLAVVD